MGVGGGEDLQTLRLLKGNRLSVQRHAFSKTVNSEIVYLPETHTLFSRTYPSKSNKGVPAPLGGRRWGGGGWLRTPSTETSQPERSIVYSSLNYCHVSL